MVLSRAHVVVSGMVQGVFFRASAREQAAARGLTGWVKNTAEARVEAIFEGEKQLVEAMIEWCKIGPPSSSVEELKVTWEEPKSDHTAFTIRY